MMIKRKGFTLVETVLALAVVGVLMTAFMVVMVPAKTAIQGGLAIQEADRLTSALTAELATLRRTERQRYNTAFDKAFDWMQKTREAKTTILVYNYRGDLSKMPREDGTPQPYTKGNEYVPGGNTIVTTAVVLANQDRKRVEEDSKAIIGPVFVVRMTQLVWDQQGSGNTAGARAPRAGERFGERGGKYTLAREPGTISNPYSSGTRISNPQDYMYNASSNVSSAPWGAEVLYVAEFFQIPVLHPKALEKLNYKNLKQPLFSRNLSFRR